MQSGDIIMQRYQNAILEKNGEVMKKVDHNTKARSSKAAEEPVKLKSKFPERKSSSSSSSSSSFTPSVTKEKLVRSKSRSRKPKEEKPAVLSEEIERYDSWDFGKIKQFKKPKNNSKNARAAIAIQRLIRGWWARIHFKIQMLEFKINNRDLLTKRALAKVKEKTKSKKEKIRLKAQDKHQNSLARLAEKEGAQTQEAQNLIQQLRSENKKLREQNQKVHEACESLRSQNERLENATSVAGGNIETLNKHAKHIKETHEKLQVVLPRYKASVDQLAEAVEVRRQFCITERAMKLMYVKCVGAIVDLAEENLKDLELVDEIVGYVLETEDADNEEPMPEKVTVEDPDEGDDSTDEVDEYTVASYDD